MDEYNKNCKRVKHIVTVLDTEYPYSKLPGSPTYIQSIQNHKFYIPNDNPLQILVAEGLYLLKLIWKYERNN